MVEGGFQERSEATEKWSRARLSSTQPIAPTDVGYDKGEGFRCVCPSGDNGLHSCDKRSRIEGSAAFVTGAFGLACASVVVRALIGR